jgi:hypothetical protein
MYNNRTYIRDCNEITLPGNYTINPGSSNLPQSNLYGQLIVIPNTENSWIIQIIITTAGKIYKRFKGSGDWSVWQSYGSYTTGEITVTTTASGMIDTNIVKTTGILIGAYCYEKNCILQPWIYDNYNYFFKATNQNGEILANTQLTIHYVLLSY